MEMVFAGGNLGDLERLTELKEARQGRRNGEGSPEALYERKEVCDRLTEAVAHLPRRYRDVIELYYRRELCMKQIGQILRVHESRVSQLHAAAILRLRTFLSGDGDSSGAASKEAAPSYARAKRPRSSKYRVTASQSSSVSTPMVSSAVSRT